MSIFYGTGTHRLIYKAQNFTTGLTVTAYIWNPSLTKSALQTFTEVSDGIYYLDYNFAVAGTHFGKFYEGGTGMIAGTFRVEADLATIEAVVDAIKAKTDNQPAGVPKNVALSDFPFSMVLSSDHVTPATSKTITATIKKDGGSFTSCANSVSEEGNGVYTISLTQAEMNADFITLKFTETNCDQRTITIKTSA